MGADSIMALDSEMLFLKSFLDSEIADIEEQIESVEGDANEAFEEFFPVEEITSSAWPDADQPADRLYSRSLEQHTDAAAWQIYDFRSANGNVSLAATDFGTGADKYLVLVRANPTGDKPTVKYADLSTALSVDEKVKVTASDTTASYLNDELQAGFGINLTVLNAGVDEKLEVSVIESDLSLANLGTKSWTNLSDTANTVGSSGDIIYNNSGVLTAVDPETLLGKHWVQGDSENTCYGTGIGNADKTKVVDLANQYLTNGNWETDGNHTADQFYVDADNYFDDTNATLVPDTGLRFGWGGSLTIQEEEWEIKTVRVIDDASGAEITLKVLGRLAA